jgi:hypothetical protein
MTHKRGLLAFVLMVALAGICAAQGASCRYGLRHSRSDWREKSAGA